MTPILWKLSNRYRKNTPQSMGGLPIFFIFCWKLLSLNILKGVQQMHISFGGEDMSF
jgi:hypothetical protein